jgi:DNA-binding transcriptional MocR family regulator
MERLRSKTTTDAFLRVVLRSLPLVPGPEVYDLIRSVGRSERDLDQQIQEAFQAISRSSDLVQELGNLLETREQELKQLQNEYARVSALSSLTAEQAEAVAQSLEKALGSSVKRERWISFSINIGAGLIIFVFGVLASDWLRTFANNIATSTP